MVDFTSVRALSPPRRLENAFAVAERDLGVNRLLEPEGICKHRLPQKAALCIIYILYIRAEKKYPSGLYIFR